MPSTPTFRAPPLIVSLVAVLAGGVACGRGSGATPATPTDATPAVESAGDSLEATLVETVRPLVAGAPADALRATGGAGSVAVEWEVRSGPCMLASPSARRVGREIVVRVARGGNPVALCVAGEVVYRYNITVRGVPAGAYRVRVLEAPVAAPARAVGVVEVVVRPAAGA